MYHLYKFAISFYFRLIHIAALFRTDARKWVRGRMNWYNELDVFIESIQHKKTPRLWIHVSSLGEFEQGRELIEMIRSHHPQLIIVLSFFSPSGYDKCKTYDKVDYVCYFPSDRYAEIKKFIELLNPQLVLFVKYDFWFNTLDLLRKKSIPFFYVSAIFRKRHFLFHPIFKNLLNYLKSAERIFLQDDKSFQYLTEHGFHNLEVCGDSRLDRVYRIVKDEISIPDIDKFCDCKEIFIAGSVWKKDMEIIITAIDHAIAGGWKIILVPHQNDEDTLQYLENLFEGNTVRYTRISETVNQMVLIMDQIGYLSRLYHYGLFAYVGGGFGKGIHNILEPVAHKKPVCFGPRNKKFREAGQFLNFGIGFEIQESEQLQNHFKKLPGQLTEIEEKIDLYFRENLGATKKMYEYLKGTGFLQNEST
jgi:3-deoxy-D-manno-octulosonic-acid transferase